MFVSIKNFMLEKIYLEKQPIRAIQYYIYVI